MENRKKTSSTGKTSGSKEPVKKEVQNHTLSEWDMSKEREFMENLINQRFNFFLIFVSLTIVGFVNARNLVVAEFILILGAIVTYRLAETLKRAQRKLDIILDDDLFHEESHPASIVNEAAGKEGSKRKLIGITIPEICTWALIGGAALHFCYMFFFWLGRLFH